MRNLNLFSRHVNYIQSLRVGLMVLMASLFVTYSAFGQDKPGSILIYPYYGSTVGNYSQEDTIITATNSGDTTQLVKFYFREKVSGGSLTSVVCLTSGNSVEYKMSEYDPGNEGAVYAMVINSDGVPIQANVLNGVARIKRINAKSTNATQHVIPAFPVRRLNSAAETVTDNTVTLSFNGTEYDQLPSILGAQPLVAPSGYPIVTITGVTNSLVAGPIANPSVRLSGSTALKAVPPGTTNASILSSSNYPLSGAGPHTLGFTSGSIIYIPWLGSYGTFTQGSILVL